MIDELLVPDIEHVFDTDGLGTWRPTTRSNPILRDTFRLYNSLTDKNNSEFIIETEELKIIIDYEDSPVFYHKFHEDGTETKDGNEWIPARPVVGLLDDTDPRIQELLETYVREIIDTILQQFGFPA